MTVYQIKYLPEKYLSFQLDIVELAEQLGDINLIDTLMSQPEKNESLLPIWGNVSHDFQALSDTSQKVIPDITPWDNTMLVMNNKAYNALKEHLEPEGEFLPITVNGEKMKAFNCLSFGKEDLSLTEKDYLDGYENGLKSLVFDEDDISNRLVFKSKMDGCARLYVSQKFKDLCEEFGLEGIRFDADLIDPF